MNYPLRRFLLVILAGVAVVTAGAGAADPFEGTWELDLAKSSFKPGPPGFKAQTRRMTRVPEGIQLVVEAVMANGGTFSGGGTYRPDGRDYPLKGIPGLDAIAVTQTGERVQTGVVKLQGRPVMSVILSVSEDGRTHTLRANTFAGSERPLDNVLVFNRK